MMDDWFCLVLENNRLYVKKTYLARKSRYFAALFSHDFSDSNKDEHVLNYNVTAQTLQNFVEWIHDQSTVHKDEYYRAPKPSLKKFTQNQLPELLNLLQLSVLLIADDLTDDIIHMIVLWWLLPWKIVEIWLLAEDLNLKALQDTCFSVCLDRFEELPVPVLVALSKENINQLIGNANIRSSTECLNFVRREWIMQHLDPDLVFIKEDRRPKFLQGLVVHETCENTKVAYLYLWDGNTLSKYEKLKEIQQSNKHLVGMQVISRGFNVYTIGGELGLGSGQFNDLIWRYNLISRKWFYQSKLPNPRRHMVTAFLKNHLVLVGGVGRHRLKLFTVDILNVHTGSWKKGARIPESFTEVPPHCVLNGKLFILKTFLYVYCLEENYWQTIHVSNDPVIKTVDTLITPDAMMFLTGHHVNDTVVSKITVVKESTCQEECLSSQGLLHKIINTTIVHEDDSYQLKYAYAAGASVMILNNNREDKHQYLHLFTEIRRDFKHSSIPKFACFNIIDPNSLYSSA